MDSMTSLILLLIALALAGFYYMGAAHRIIDWIMKKLFED